jgi:hypothetical protein
VTVKARISLPAGVALDDITPFAVVHLSLLFFFSFSFTLPLAFTSATSSSSSPCITIAGPFFLVSWAFASGVCLGGTCSTTTYNPCYYPRIYPIHIFP